MKPKLSRSSIWTIFIVLFLFSSCTSSKKFDYASAYKFRTIKHQPKAQSDEESLAENEKVLTVSTEAIENEDLKREIEKSRNELLEKVGLIEEGEKLTESELKERVKSLDKKEKRKIRKELIHELKSEIKSLKKMEKSDASSTLETNDINLTGYTRIGVIMGGLGIIVLILGALFAVGALSIVGAILIIGGVVFILVDILQ